MRKMRDSGVAWIGEIPEGWNITKLKYFLLSNDGGLWGEEPTGENDIIVLRSTEQTIDGEWIIENPAFRHVASDYLDAFLLKEGDLVITKSSGSELHIGKTSIVTKNIENLICAFSNFMQRIRVTQNSLPRLVWYWMNSDIVREQFIYTSNTTSGLSNINSKNINELFITLPALHEQQRIADYLDTKCAEIDRSMELVRQGIDKLKAYKMSVITESVTKGLDTDVSMKDSGVAWIGEIPEGWRIVPLKKQLRNIVDYRGKTPEKVNSGVFLVTAKNIKNGKIDYSLSQEYVSEKEYYAIMSRGLPRKGDILFTTEAPLGEVAIVDREDIALAQRIIKFTVNSFVLNNLYLKYWITSSGFQFFLHTLSTGSTAEGIKSSKIFMLPLVLPPLPEQHRITSYLDAKCAEIDAIIAKKQNLLDKLAEYKKSLIFECVTGKREVTA